MNTLRYESGERPPLPLTYWRRRFLALVVGLAVLATIAWAFSGVLEAGGRSLAAGTGHGPREHGARAGTAASGASGPGPAPGSSAAPHASPSSPTPSSEPSPAAAALPSPSPGPAQIVGPASSGLPRACPPSEVVLSLLSGQDSYGPGQMPEFDVDVVSTSARACAFNVGPKFLDLTVTAGGKRIWNSADCVAGRGSLLTDLARGVPTVLPLSWDRQTSVPGCAVASRPLPAGSFAAAASDGGLASNSVTFKLS